MVKKLPFSYSKMGLYKECPQKYKFRYIWKLPEEAKYYFAFGTAMHKVMEYIYGVSEPPFPALDASLKFFERDWKSTTYKAKGYASAAKEAEGFIEGNKIIKEYYAKNEPAFFVPLSTELKTTLDMDNLSLISIIDRVDYLGGGRVNILDYKTGKNVDREPDQLYMYQKVVENSPLIKQIVQTKDPAATEVRVEKMSFYHLPSQSEISFERAPDSVIGDLWADVLSVADNIRAEKYAPSPAESKCRWCDYRAYCPVFTGVEFTGIKTEKPAIAAPAIDALGDKIDLYGQKIAELKVLRAEILAEMQANNFNQHFGKNFKAELKESECLNFENKEAVVAFLKEKDLLKKTLVPTQSTVEALLLDPAVSSEHKAALQAMAATTKTRELNFKKTEE